MSASGRQLNPADCAMLTVDRVLRRMGAYGFETQTLVWLSGRIDVATFRVAIARLGALYPVVTARVIEGKRPFWQFRPDAVCALDEIDLPSPGAEAVHACAGRLLSAPSDPAEKDPLRFHLLHRPDGRDVLVVQYNHALMDNNGAVPLLREIDRLHRVGAEAPECPCEEGEEGRDVIWQYLGRFPSERRRQAASNSLRLLTRSARGGVASLGGGMSSTACGEVRVLTRCLDGDACQALQARVSAVGGYPGLSMAVAGSAFRAIGRLAPHQGSTGRGLVAGIGLDLGLRGPSGPIFQNLMSLVPINARPADLEDRDELVRMLSRQMRERLAGDADLGVLQLMALMFRQPRPDVVWAIDLFLRHGFSLWYAYFGSLDALGDSLCGTPIEMAFYTGPAWSAVGLTLLVNQYHGRMFFQATYTPQTVGEEMAERFLEAVIGDLVR